MVHLDLLGEAAKPFRDRAGGPMSSLLRQACSSQTLTVSPTCSGWTQVHSAGKIENGSRQKNRGRAGIGNRIVGRIFGKDQALTALVEIVDDEGEMSGGRIRRRVGGK